MKILPLIAILSILLVGSVSAMCHGPCGQPQGQEWVTYHPEVRTVPKIVLQQKVSYRPVVHGVYYQPIQDVKMKPYYEVKYKPVVNTKFIPQYYSYSPGMPGKQMPMNMPYGGGWR